MLYSQAVSLFGHAAEEKRVRLTLAFANDVPYAACIDCTRVQQVWALFLPSRPFFWFEGHISAAATASCYFIECSLWPSLLRREDDICSV